MFPTHSFLCPASPFPTRWLPRVGSPLFLRYYEDAKTSGCSFPRSSFSFERGFTSLTPSSFARLGLLESLPLRLGVGRPVSPLAPVLSLLEELSRFSQVPRVPFRAFALLLDPGRISTPSLLRRFDSAPAVRTTKAPTFNIISRLNHTAFAPLHTLRAAIADDYAMFASGRWLAFAGWGCFPHWVPVLCCIVFSGSCFLSDYMLFLTFWVFLTRPVSCLLDSRFLASGFAPLPRKRVLQ